MPVKSKGIYLAYLKKTICSVCFLFTSLHTYPTESVQNKKLIKQPNCEHKKLIRKKDNKTLEQSPFCLLENEIKKQGIIKKSGAAPFTKNTSYFCANEGKTLKKVIDEWSITSSWKLIWEAEYDYPILAAACFTGTFSEASSRLIDAYKDADHPLYLDMYPSQQVAVISN